LSKDLTTCTADCSVKYCNRCPDGPCTVCIDGYSLSVINGTQKCLLNPCNATNCQLCSTNGTCIKCAQYMVMKDGNCVNNCTINKCLSCKPKSWLCDVCQDGLSFNYWIEAC
jgi:hypothetical protein